MNGVQKSSEREQPLPKSLKRDGMSLFDFMQNTTWVWRQRLHTAFENPGKLKGREAKRRVGFGEVIVI
jgi:hypothetical protein